MNNILLILDAILLIFPLLMFGLGRITFDDTLLSLILVMLVIDKLDEVIIES